MGCSPGKFFTQHAKFIIVTPVIVTVIGLSASGFRNNNDDKIDSAKSLAAFEKVYKVLMSPRCMNCHPAGDIPLQGDDSHLHTMSPTRGKMAKVFTP